MGGWALQIDALLLCEAVIHLGHDLGGCQVSLRLEGYYLQSCLGLKVGR